jgi:glyoxylase I family protein
MRILGFHHVALICSHYERSKSFYVDALGFTILAETHRQGRDSYKLDLVGPGGMRLELFSFPDPPARVDSPEACGLRHLAFVVEDIEEAVRELSSRGVPCEEIRVDALTGCRYTFFKDPDGLPLEFYEERPVSFSTHL